jgi:alkylhydroperoxidase/carboxymuconolactone decarboxylase family protein YurZ
LAAGGHWTDSWLAVLQLDPQYFAAYAKLRSVPMSRRTLPLKIQELILLARDAACTTMYLPGVKVHTEAALAAGASKAEVMEVLELTSVLGIHAMNVGVPLLVEVLEEEGIQTPVEPPALTPQQTELKETFQFKRGYWHATWEAVLRLDPEFFEAYTEYSSVPFEPERSQVLELKTKELVYVAIDAATTHLYTPGLKLHIRNAVKYGATAAEVMEVLELCSLMGVQTALVGAPILFSAA